MSFQVTLQPSGLQFAAPSDETVLQSALAAGLLLPYSCRDGACGVCKSRVLEGRVEYERPAAAGTLTDDERAAGIALLCCAKPQSDLVVEVRQVSRVGDIPVKKLPSRVQKLERVADDVIVLELKLPASEKFQFLAGQYIDFLLADGRRRSFSIANAPDAGGGHLELHVRRIDGGEFTGHVFERLKEKDILRFEGPLGSFHLREDSELPIVLVAGGTGFAPIKSIVEHALATGIRRPMTLYWGARTADGLYLRELAERWTHELPGFRFVPVLSDAPADGWSGRRGLVHAAVLEDLPDLSGVEVYACGAPAMIDAARRDFGAHGLPAERFFADSFSFSADAVA